MNRIALIVLAVLWAWPLLRGEDKPSAPRQQYDALVVRFASSSLYAAKGCPV
jgi:hypothetical protein